MRRRILQIAAASASASVFAGIASAATLTVTPGNLQGWTPTDGVGWSHAFVTGPATPPAGTGSYNMSTTTDGSEAGQLRRTDFNGALLSSLTSLSYSTYATTNNGQQLPYLLFNVDLDNNGSTDDFLFFEPDYQATPPVASATTGAWQTWDALSNRGWYGNVGSATESGSINLTDYIAANPGAKFATTAAGAFRVVSGFASPTDDFDVNVDKVNINGTTYNFEAPAAVPLPATAWMGLALIGGMGGLGGIKRLRRPVA